MPWGRRTPKGTRLPVVNRPLEHQSDRGYGRRMTSAVGDLLVRAWRVQRAGDPDGVYDEVLRQVSARAAAEGALGKADIGALVLWKRITAQTKWANTLMLKPDAEVREATGQAYEFANDPSVAIPDAGQVARDVLWWNVPGMRGTAALASAVLLALAPERMAVWDLRVGHALTALGRYPDERIGFYGTYLTTALDLADAMGSVSGEGPFVPRDVDLALFHIAGNDELLAEARMLADIGAVS